MSPEMSAWKTYIIFKLIPVLSSALIRPYQSSPHFPYLPEFPLHAISISEPPPHFGFGQGLPNCFFRALSQIAGRRRSSPHAVGPPNLHLFEHMRTPKQDFFKMWTLWLFVFRMAQPELRFWIFLIKIFANSASK